MFKIFLFLIIALNYNANSGLLRVILQNQNHHGKEIGEIIALCGQSMLGNPYVGKTLDSNDTIENIVVDTDNVDCVTFVENAVAIARAIRESKEPNEDDVYSLVEHTRYRDGKNTGYLSRLHYTSEWINDNIKKGVIEDITKSLKGEKFKPKVSFMGNNYFKYKQLRANPDFVPTIKEIEREINNYDNLYHIEKLDVNKRTYIAIKSGDIICITTSISGLDYSHLGLALVENEKVKFMHASSDKKKVVIEEDLKNYLRANKKALGITILRVK